MINVEISNPTASAAPFRPPDSNGWYNHPVAVGFGIHAFSGIAGCTAPTTYAGPDTSSRAIFGSCVDNAGKRASAGTSLRYDATPPTITAARPRRRPDHHGWYNHPVAFAFSGTDATSGLIGCQTNIYSGPNSAGASVIGSCRDRAGNVATRAVPLRYDSGPLSLRAGAGVGDGLVSILWRTGADVAPITSLKVVRRPGLGGAKRSVIYRGHRGGLHDRRVRNGVHYRYTIIAIDQAGNKAVRTIHATAGPHILSPVSGAQVVVPPLLTWTPVRHADYYNVQLYRGRHKVLSIWPRHPRLQLRLAWRFEGHRHRLTPGRYRWYVWPGFGQRSAGRYGKAIGSGMFVMTGTA